MSNIAREHQELHPEEAGQLEEGLQPQQSHDPQFQGETAGGYQRDPGAAYEPQGQAPVAGQDMYGQAAEHRHVPQGAMTPPAYEAQHLMTDAAQTPPTEPAALGLESQDHGSGPGAAYAPQDMPVEQFAGQGPVANEAPGLEPQPQAPQPVPPAHDAVGLEAASIDDSAPVAPIPSPDEDWVPPQPNAAPPPAQGPMTAADVDAKPLPRINIQAFCEDQNTAAMLQTASQDRRLSKTHVSVQMGGLEAAAHYYRNAPTPNLIIIESMHNRDGMIMDIDRLASVCDSGTKVIVIGHVNDVLLYRELLQRGVSEYLVMPLSVSQLMQSLSGLYNDPSADPLGSVLAFVGAKGGVGSSTVCHNTAWTISQDIQSDVVIADLDLPFGTAGLDFNQDPVQGIADALLSPERLDDVLLDRLLSRCSDYLSLFAAPGTLDRPYDLNANSCDVVVDVLRKNVPYIAMDVPHIWTDWAQRVLMQADRVVITALPDLANLRNTKNLVEKLVAARPNDLPPLLVLNQLGVPKRPEISVKDFANAVDTDPVSIIEFDTQLFGTAANNGQMIEEVSEKAKAVEQFHKLAGVLTDREEAKVESKSIFAPLLSRFSRGGGQKASNKKAGKK